MATSDSAGILFRIRADSRDAETKIKDFRKGLADLDKDLGPMQNIAAQAGLTAEEFKGLQSAGLMVAGAFTAVAGAAVGVAVGIFQLTKATADYGSTLYDATIQTGLSARSISALKLAADTSGSSLESVAGAVSKLNVLVGNAANGNEKAAATLKQYGITATDTNGAFTQAVKVIGDMTSSTQRAAAMAALFKDRTGEIGPVLDAIGRDFEEFIVKAEKLGLVLTEQDLKAADDFGDTLDILGKQAAAAGQRFAFELMPNVTHAMEAISGSMQGNQSVAQQWGRVVGDVIRGVEVALPALELAFIGAMEGIAQAFGANISASVNWANVLLANLGIVGQALAALRVIGQSDPIQGKVNLGEPEGQMGPFLPPKAVVTAVSGGGGRARGGGGGGVGGSAKNDAERARKKEIDDAEKAMRADLDIYAAGSKERLAILDNELAQRLISEREYTYTVATERETALVNEKLKTEQLLKNDKLKFNEAERAEIVQKIKVLEIEIRIEKLKGANESIALSKKETEEANRQLEIEKQKLEEEQKRLEVARQRRQLAQFDQAKDRRDYAIKRDRETTVGSGSEISALGQLHTAAVEKLSGAESTAAIAGIEAMSAAFEGLGQALGQVVNAWALYGEAGASVKQVTAQILAGIAQQATIKAIFELAEGFAALALAFFGIPNAGPSASAHFAAAAIYGSIAGVAAITGRAVAGDSFKKDSNQSTGRKTEGTNKGESDPYSRQSQGAFDSGSRNSNDPRSIKGGIFGQQQQQMIDAANRIAASTDKFVSHVEAQPANAIFARVSNRLVAEKFIQAGKSNHGVFKELRGRSNSK